MNDNPLAVVVFFIALAAYGIPTMIAWHRRSVLRWYVLALNLLLGWSVIAWLIALVMALMSEAEPELP